MCCAHVSDGKTNLVGERGPELFTWTTTGANLPHHALAGTLT